MICLDEQVLGGYGCKLACGHLFHLSCLKEWLTTQCTCPICRFELETDNSSFERGRKCRMGQRKLRFRRDELFSKPIRELKVILRDMHIVSTDCVDKRDLVEKIINSGKVDILEGIPPVQYTLEQMCTKSVGELKHMAKSFGLNTDGILEKRELVDRIVASGRVELVVDVATVAPEAADTYDQAIYAESASSPPPVKDTMESCPAGAIAAFEDEEAFWNSCVEETEAELQKEASPSTHTAYSFCGSVASSFSQNKFDDSSSENGISSEVLRTMSMADLLGVMQALGVDYSDCLEKDDAIKKVMAVK